MALPEKDQGPGGESEALMTSLAGDLHMVVAPTDTCRCTRCRRPLRAPLSVRLGVGPVCWLRVFGVAA